MPEPGLAGADRGLLTVGDKRYLIVNADDFGRSPGVNRGIIEAHGSGIVTSASLMVRWPAAAEAAAYAREHPDLVVGLHFDLGEWIYREGAWLPASEVVPADNSTAMMEERLDNSPPSAAASARIPPSWTPTNTFTCASRVVRS